MPHSSLSTDYSFAANKFPTHWQSSIWKHAEIDLEESPPIRRAAVSSHIFHLLCEPELLFLRFLPYILHCKTQGRRGKYNPIQFAKLMWQKIAIPTFLLPHYISHFLNLLKQLRRRKYSTPQYPIYIVTILSISPFTLRLI